MEGFNSAATAYNSQNALWLGKAAALAYEEITTVKQSLPGWDVTPITSPKTDTEGFIAGNDDLIVISFRGTEPGELKDWLVDLDMEMVHGPAGKVHEGFYDAVSSIWEELVAALRRIRQNGQTLWITGHSLGGAVAIIACARLLKEEVVTFINGVYTFGQPRSGDRNFAAWLDGAMKTRIIRLVNNNDIVPHLPLPPLYKHAGTFLYFDSDEKIQVGNGFWQCLKDRLESQVKSLYVDKFVPDEIEDHFMANYLEQLEKNVARQPKG